MPFVVRSDSENENEAELVFLSPEEEPPRPKTTQVQADQGASPVLRRSNRKRKSTAAYSDSEMSRNSGSKKKKGSSPEVNKTMPKIPRTPQAQEQPAQQSTPQPQGQAQAQPQVSAIEALLTGMEGRLSSKIDSTNEKVDRALSLVADTNAALENLENRVADNESKVADIMTGIGTNVKGIVLEQLRAVGFDPDLSAADLSTRLSARPVNGSSVSYAAVATRTPGPESGLNPGTSTIAEKREEKFLEARRSLRLWPVRGGDWRGVKEYLLERLDLSEDFVEGLEGEVKKPRETKGRNRDEFIVTFSSKIDRDAVRAAAPALANSREEAGMRLHVPDHLQKKFRALMNLSYDLKQKHPELRRNVKFDDDEQSLYLDIQLNKDADWNRIEADQAVEATRGRGGRVKGLGTNELQELLGGPSNDRNK